MCIIVAHPHTGDIVPEETLEQCAANNPDGMGIAYVKDGTLSVFHHLTRFKKLVGKYKHAVKHGADVLIHFRVATHGEVAPRNCHPFWVNPDLVMAHNGQINIPALAKSTGQGTLTDTQSFIRRVMQPLVKNVPDWDESNAVHDLILDYIGHSKLVFLDRNGKLTIIGEQRGTWDKDQAGAWFSNDSYLPVQLIYGGGKQRLGFTTEAGGTEDFTTGYHNWLNDLKEANDPDAVLELNDVLIIEGGVVACAHCIEAWSMYLNLTHAKPYLISVDQLNEPIHCELCNIDCGVYYDAA